MGLVGENESQVLESTLPCVLPVFVSLLPVYHKVKISSTACSWPSDVQKPRCLEPSGHSTQKPWGKLIFTSSSWFCPAFHWYSTHLFSAAPQITVKGVLQYGLWTHPYLGSKVLVFPAGSPSPPSFPSLLSYHSMLKNQHFPVGIHYFMK